MKKCPNCNSTRITEIISVEEKKYIKKIGCKKCGYCNHLYIGDCKS
ncbi:MAG TPA: hypothetical protein VGB37_14735 [Candidatus Lokiarchaeia archaeon]